MIIGTEKDVRGHRSNCRCGWFSKSFGYAVDAILAWSHHFKHFCDHNNTQLGESVTTYYDKRSGN